jgi:hypothetical protein
MPDYVEMAKQSLARLQAAREAPAVQRRVSAFAEQIAAWKATGRAVTQDQVGLSGQLHPAVPVFVLPGVESVPSGCCMSCGEPLSPGRMARCAPCIDAIQLVLES